MEYFSELNTDCPTTTSLDKLVCVGNFRLCSFSESTPDICFGKVLTKSPTLVLSFLGTHMNHKYIAFYRS